MVTLRLFSLDGYTLVRFEGESPPASPLWMDLGVLRLPECELSEFLDTVARQNARVTGRLKRFKCLDTFRPS